jgi:hypothetical protein
LQCLARAGDQSHPPRGECDTWIALSSPRPDLTAALLALVAALALLGGCDDPGDPIAPMGTSEPSLRAGPHLGPFSADAHHEIAESLKLDLATPRHESDGGGRAFIAAAFSIERGREPVPAPRNDDDQPIFRVSAAARLHIVYEAGRLGVAEGGVVFLQVSPFWDWDDPQPTTREAAGFTVVSTSADGVTLAPVLAAQQLLAIEIGGRPLAPGERIEIVYGAGPLGARVDRYAERSARIWLAVDGDGDGLRRLLADSPKVEIRPDEPAWLVVNLPTTAEPGDEVRVTLALLDPQGNAGVAFDGVVELAARADTEGEGEGPGLTLPAKVRFEPEHRGRRTIIGRAEREGTVRLTATAQTNRGPLEARSNPLVVRTGIEKVLWGDLHGHSQLSDGTGTPSDFYDYARNIASLDVAALTDHDHWGMRFLDANPDMWDEIRAAAEHFNEPGRFVTLLGYEWTSWLQGHRHVLYFADHGEVLSSVDSRYETPDQLWTALRGKQALTFAHHSAGGPISTNWTFAPPPDLEPITEIVSVHGSSEAPDSPDPIYNPVPGNSVRDALMLGYRFGFIGSSDSHDGHPGLAEIASPGASGIAAIRATASTREAVLEALRARNTYATNGPRIYLETSLEPGPDTSTLRFHVTAAATIDRIDFIRTGLTATLPGNGRLEWTGERTIPNLRPNEYVYLRVIQEDGGTAWSSPIYGTTN